MAMFKTKHGYGGATKVMHWLIALLFALQYTSAAIMLRTPGDGATLGVSQATYYNWHKSLGLVVLVTTVFRLLNRAVGELPPWASTLSPVEKMAIHKAETLLYAAMLIMPLSGFVYVMAGDYGVKLFGIVDLPNPIGPVPLLATVARWVHVGAGILLLLPLGLHLGLVLGHHFGLKDRLIHRMLPHRRDL